MTAILTTIPEYSGPDAPYAAGGGEYVVGTVVELTAYSAPGYYFSHWSDSAGHLFYENPLNVRVGESGETYTANFSVQPSPEPEDEGEDQPGTKPEYTVTVSCDPPNGGTATGGGVYEQGDVCTITATENPLSPQLRFVGWENTGWTNPDGKLLKKRTHSFQVFDDETWIAIFRSEDYYPEWTDDDEAAYEDGKKRSRKTINVYVEPVPAYEGDNSTTTGGGTFYAGETCTLTAHADTSENPDNHFVCWKRTDGNSATDTAIEIRTENPYSFHVYPPDQRWWGIFGTGLTRVSVSSNLPVKSDGSQGGAVWITDEYVTFEQDKVYCDSPYNRQIRAATFLREDVIRGRVGIEYQERFLRPQQDGDIGIWMPEYIIERKSGKITYYPSGDVKQWFFDDVIHWTGRIYYAYKEYDVVDFVDEVGPVIDLYVHFVPVGFILRNSSDIILRNNTNILRGNG